MQKQQSCSFFKKISSIYYCCYLSFSSTFSLFFLIITVFNSRYCYYNCSCCCMLYCCYYYMLYNNITRIIYYAVTYLNHYCQTGVPLGYFISETGITCAELTFNNLTVAVSSHGLPDIVLLHPPGYCDDFEGAAVFGDASRNCSVFTMDIASSS